MKWLNLLLVGVVVFASNACERHSVNDLKVIEMPGEPPVKVAAQNAEAPASSAPAADSKPAPGYIPK